MLGKQTAKWLTLLLVFGCTSNSVKPTGIEVTEFINEVAMNLSVYQGWVNEQYYSGSYTGIGVCLNEVKLNLATSLARSADATAGATLVLGAASTGSPSFGFNRSDTTKTNYEIVLAPDYTTGRNKTGRNADGFVDASMRALTDAAKSEYPFAATLFFIRGSVIDSMPKLRNPKFGAGLSTSSLSTVFTFSVVQTTSGGLNISVGPVSAGGKLASTTSAENVATVSFAAIPKGQNFCGAPADKATAAASPSSTTTIPYINIPRAITNDPSIFQQE